MAHFLPGASRTRQFHVTLMSKLPWYFIEASVAPTPLFREQVLQGFEIDFPRACAQVDYGAAGLVLASVQEIVTPLSTGRTWPVTIRDSSLAR
jgi:hypothetical protein